MLYAATKYSCLSKIARMDLRTVNKNKVKSNNIIKMINDLRITGVRPVINFITYLGQRTWRISQGSRVYLCGRKLLSQNVGSTAIKFFLVLFRREHGWSKYSRKRKYFEENNADDAGKLTILNSRHNMRWHICEVTLGLSLLKAS